MVGPQNPFFKSLARHNSLTVAEKIAHFGMPEPNSGCLLWTGAVDRPGYGQLLVNGKWVGAHRAAWALEHGPIPTGLMVCHKCDVPACVNPAHMFLGTAADNTRDAARKGRLIIPRQPLGEASPNAKLTTAEVRSILADNRPCGTIAASYGVAFSTISMIKRGINWRHISNPGA